MLKVILDCGTPYTASWSSVIKYTHLTQGRIKSIILNVIIIKHTCRLLWHYTLSCIKWSPDFQGSWLALFRTYHLEQLLLAHFLSIQFTPVAFVNTGICGPHFMSFLTNLSHCVMIITGDETILHTFCKSSLLPFRGGMHHYFWKPWVHPPLIK